MDLIGPKLTEFQNFHDFLIHFDMCITHSLGTYGELSSSIVGMFLCLEKEAVTFSPFMWGWKVPFTFLTEKGGRRGAVQ